jgi:putative transposase
MARLLRMEFPGAIYHVTFRGNQRKALFKSDADRQRLLRQIAEARDLYQTRIYLVCLMPNHVHLLLETPRGNLSAFMGQLLTAYTVFFNRRHQRVGHLLQGRFQARVVEGDDYLLKLSRYVHLNPVSGRRWQGQPDEVRRECLRDYRWSTYRSFVGVEKPWPWIEYAPLLAMVTAKGHSPAASYAQYVQLGLAKNDEAFGRIYRESRLGLGSPGFVADLRVRYQRVVAGQRNREDAALRKRIGRRSAKEVLAVVAQELGVEEVRFSERHRNSWLRAVAAWALQRHGGLNQRAVADVLGMGTGAGVSQQQAKFRTTVDLEPHWRALTSAIDRRLE